MGLSLVLLGGLTQARWSSATGVRTIRNLAEAEAALQRLQSRGSPPLRVQVKLGQPQPVG